jgi:cleavage and polyadenylation specificity factor subunit 1
LEVSSYTCVLTVIHVSPSGCPSVNTIEGLPHDCFDLIAIPEPLGGALILSPNVIIYTNTNSRFAFGLNHFALNSNNSQFPLSNASSELPMLSLDACHYTLLTTNRLLVSLSNGDLYIFHLEDDGLTVCNINISKAGAAAIASCVCTTYQEVTTRQGSIGLMMM